jgi:hypothetical protein
MSIVTIYHPANVKRGGEKIKIVAIFPASARGLFKPDLLKGLQATFCGNTTFEDGANKAVRFGAVLKETLPYEPLYSPA